MDNERREPPEYKPIGYINSEGVSEIYPERPTDEEIEAYLHELGLISKKRRGDARPKINRRRKSAARVKVKR